MIMSSWIIIVDRYGDFKGLFLRLGMGHDILFFIWKK